MAVLVALYVHWGQAVVSILGVVRAAYSSKANRADVLVQKAELPFPGGTQAVALS